MSRVSTTMPPPAANTAHHGIMMDRPLPPKRHRWLLPCMMAALAITALLWLLGNRASFLTVIHTPQLARVVVAVFHDELVLRARVEPLRSVQLDAPEGGRVEAVLAQDGDWIEAGAPLYQLHSPEQEQLLMQRSAEVAQQLANVSLQRSAQVASLAQNRRELAQLHAAQLQADSDYQRLSKLAGSGFISAAALEQAERQRRLTAILYTQARRDQQLEAKTRQQSLDEMARAVEGLRQGLDLLERARDRLLQRAPIAGRLSGFQLQVGTTVRLGDRLGRIDDLASGMQLIADIDEYYLPRLQTGQQAVSAKGTVTLTQTLPQVKEGKARVRLRWPSHMSAPSELRPGQAIDVRLQLSAPARALVLPDGPGVQTRLYVREGNELQRRLVQLGRRAGGQVEVLAGLHPGDEVLISQPPNDSERFSLP